MIVFSHSYLILINNPRCRKIFKGFWGHLEKYCLVFKTFRRPVHTEIVIYRLVVQTRLLSRDKLYRGQDRNAGSDMH